MDSQNQNGRETERGSNSLIPKGYIRSFLARVTDPTNAATETPPGTMIPYGQEDCMACRVTGAAGCSAVGAYLYYEVSKVPKTNYAHRIALMSMATGFFVLGAYRAFM